MDNRKTQKEKTIRQPFFSHIVLTSMILLILLVSCSGVPGGPNQKLIGTWVNTPDFLIDTFFGSQLIFQEDGTLISKDELLSIEKNYRYAVIAPGKIKISDEEVSILFDYTVTESSLTLTLEGTDLLYTRVDVPAQIDEPQVDTPQEDTSQQDTPVSIASQETPLPPEVTRTIDYFTPTGTVSSPAVPEDGTPADSSSEYRTPTPAKYFPLGDCPASQLHVGDSAFISYGGGANSVRRTPDTHPSDNIIGRIESGTVMEIIDGPVCNYGWVLWKIRTTKDLIGWTPETNGSEFWMLPLATRDLCPYALPTRLIAGKKAFVMEEADLANRVRRAPNTSAEIIDRIKPGEKMLVLEGPECGEGANWWKVQSQRTGVVGWTAEGTTTEYYIAPIP